jgi:hypothetical protein
MQILVTVSNNCHEHIAVIVVMVAAFWFDRNRTVVSQF